MANQGLFTQGPSVEDILAKRRKRSTDLQQTLMQQAAMGARDPAKAKAISFLGSSLGQALAGSLNKGKDSEVEKIKAQEAAQAEGQKAYFAGMKAGTSEGAFESAKILQERFPAQAAEMLQLGQQLKKQEEAAEAANAQKRQDALDVSIENEELQNLANKLSQGLEEEAPQLYEVNTNGTATQETVAEAMRLQREKKERELKEAQGDSKSADIKVTEVGVFGDDKGNLWHMSTSIEKGSTDAETIYTPVGSAPPYDPDKHGQLQGVNSNNLTTAQVLDLEQSKTEAKEKVQHWATVRTDAGKSLTNLQSQEAYITRATDLLAKIETGGMEKHIKEFTDFFGITSSDVGEFDVLTAQSALSQLKTTFGGNPTEGERAILFEIQANISLGKGINKRILEAALAQNLWRQELKKKALTDKSNGDEYYEFLANNKPPQYKVDPVNEAAFRRQEENLKRKEQGLELLPEIDVRDSMTVENVTSWGAL